MRGPLRYWEVRVDFVGPDWLSFTLKRLILLIFLLTPLSAVAATPAALETYAYKAAQMEGVNPDHLVATLRCETHFKEKAVGDYGESFGVAQIHLPDHPEVSSKQALNGYWAIDWTIKQFYDGHASLWSCWRRLYS